MSKDAISNSSTLEAYRLDLKYFEDNLALYEEYDGYEFGSEYETLTYEIERNASKLQESEWNVEINVEEAIGDIVALENDLVIKADAYKNAFTQNQQGESQYELGLAKLSDLHALELQLQSAKMSYDQADRALKNAKVKFNMLLEYGIEYK